MTYFDLDACLKVIPNRYELILLAKTRTDEILSGSSILTQKAPNEKNFVSALNEISSGLHDYYSLNEKTIAKIRNDICGVSVQIHKDKSLADKFDEESLFSQIFQTFDTNKIDKPTTGFNAFNLDPHEMTEIECEEDLTIDNIDEGKLDFS